MARRNRTRPQKRTHELHFPIGGIHKGAPNPKQPPFTTPDCLNVRPRDVRERRERGGIRPGLIKAFAEQIGGFGTDKPIRLLAQVSHVVQDGFNFFIDPWFDEFLTGVFSPEWSVASWIGVKPTIEAGTVVARNGQVDETSGLVRALLEFDLTKNYEVTLNILPSAGKHHGVYQIFVRMDTNNPVVTTDGVLIALTMTDTKGSWSLVMTEYVAGTPTVFTGVDGSLVAFPILTWGTNGSGDGQFNDPRGIRVNPFTEEVFVCDSANNRVQVFDKAGTFQSKFGTSGSGDGQFAFTTGIAFSPTGHIFVGDRDNHRVQHFDTAKAFVSKFGTSGTGDGQFNNPWGVAIMSNNNSNKIVVVDGSNHRIQIFTSAEVFSSKFGSLGSADGQFSNPRGVVLDSNDNIYVADNGNDRIQVFDSSGTFLYKFGTSGTGDGNLDAPFFLDFFGDQYLYISDGDNNRLSRWIRKLDFSSEHSTNFDPGVVLIGGFNAADQYFIFQPVDNKKVWEIKTNGSRDSFNLSVGTGNGRVSGSTLDSLSVAIDSTNKHYVTDAGNNRIVVMSSSFKFDSNVALTANDLREIAIDSTDNLWISTQASSGGIYQLKAYNTAGAVQFTVGTGNAGSDNGDFGGLTGAATGQVAFDSAGNAWVADPVNNRVQKFNSSGVYQDQFGTLGTADGQFTTIGGLVIDSDDRIYVSDTITRRIQAFDLNGDFLFTAIKATDTFNGSFLAPLRLFFDSSGLLYVGASGQDRIVVLTAPRFAFDANTVTVGTRLGEFTTSTGIGIDSVNSIAFVGDDNDRITRFDLSSATESLSGDLKVVVSGANIKANWRGFEMIDQNVGASTKKKVGFGMDCTESAGKCITGSITISYFLTETPRRIEKLAVASANGEVWRESEFGVMEKVVSSLTLNADRQLQATEFNQKLYIADYGDDVLTGSSGTIDVTGFLLDDAGVADWTAQNIDTDDHVVVITNGSANVTNGVYSIASLAATELTLVQDAGTTGTCTYRITRGPKIYDPGANTLSLWLATAGKGEVPTGTTLLSLYRGRMSMTGDPALPNVWYHSRQDDPLDWQYSDTVDDVARAILGQNNDFGVVGEPITAQAPFSDDFLIFGAANSMWVLRGDAAFNGQIDNISYRTGIMSGDAFTFGPSGELIFLGRDGIYMLQSGTTGSVSSPASVSGEYLPDSLRDINPDAFQTTLEYDIVEQGVHIYISPLDGGVQRYYWMDWEHKRFFPSTLQIAHEPIKTLGFTALDKTRAVLHGCRDGFIRKYSRLFVTDEAFAIASHVLLGPFYLGGSELFQGVLKELSAIMGKNSGDVAWKLFVGDTHQDVITNALLAAAPDSQGMFKKGFNFNERIDRRGGSAVLRIEGISGESAWALEQIISISRDSGRLRKLV